MARLVVAGASPVLASSDFLFPIRPSLFNAEGHGYNRGEVEVVGWTYAGTPSEEWCWSATILVPGKDSVAISEAMRCQCGSTWFCCSFFWIYVRLFCRSVSMEVGHVYLESVRTCQFNPGCKFPRRVNPLLNSCWSC